MSHAYYNEIDPYAAQWLRNLIGANLIPRGAVDERSIVDVQPEDLTGYTQCHFFAGIGGWSYAARLAGWPDERPVWTGSCPCQPFSVAGKGEGQADARHLWPEFFRLISARRPDVVMGEQVAAAVGKHWLDGVCADLESVGYAIGAVVVPACAVDAPHRRDRLWFVADADIRQHQRSIEGICPGRDAVGGSGQAVADTANSGCGEEYPHNRRVVAGDRSQRFAAGLGSGHGTGVVAVAQHSRREGRNSPRDPWKSSAVGASSEGCSWIVGADGKARRVEPGIRLLAHGVPARVGKLRAYGNAIVPQVAAEIIGAYMDCRP